MIDQFKKRCQFFVVCVKAAGVDQLSGDGTERSPQGLPRLQRTGDRRVLVDLAARSGASRPGCAAGPVP